nr:MAG TPA: hypothetical protein [Caudoviricetes sp.]
MVHLSHLDSSPQTMSLRDCRQFSTSCLDC